MNPRLRFGEGSLVELRARNFQVNGVAASGDVTELTGVVSGIWVDGTQFSLPFERDPGGMGNLGFLRLTVVPEPSVGLLAFLAGGSFLARRRRLWLG